MPEMGRNQFGSAILDTLTLDQENQDIVLARVAANTMALAQNDRLALDYLLLDRTNRDHQLSRLSATHLLLSGGLKLGDTLHMNSKKITNVLDPTDNQDGDTKAARAAAIATHAALTATHGVSGTIADAADLTTHAADLEAHTKDWFDEILVGGYYTGLPIGYPGTMVLTAGRLYVIPFIVVRLLTFDQIAIDVTGAVASSHARLGIYNLGADFEPSTLVQDFGVVDTSGTGVKPAVADQQLNKGWYAFAVLADDAITLRKYEPVGYSPRGMQSGNLSNAEGLGYAAQTYGALPAAAPSMTWTTNPIIMAGRIKSLDT